MVSREDHETYRALVYTLCDKYMISADPESSSIRVNIDRDSCKFIEIEVAIIGYHIKMYDRYHRFFNRAFLREINQVLEFINSIA